MCQTRPSQSTPACDVITNFSFPVDKGCYVEVDDLASLVDKDSVLFHESAPQFINGNLHGKMVIEMPTSFKLGTPCL